ncbi:MAG: metal ABC transporter substrate-binding protein [Actinomycetaceae bacterium]|nr:metal ABC transporter substrate-binding protein [Actinomycetaceae bacterium]
MNIRKSFIALGASAALILAGCGTASEGEPGNSDSGALDVKASFYPLQYLVEQVGADKVSVDSLTPPGADAHSLELSPKGVAEISASDAVVYLKGFQSSVDAAIAEAGPSHVLDVTDAAKLAETGVAHDHEGETPEEHAEHAEEGHEGETPEEHAEHAHEGDDHGHAHDLEGDPHFWLDPQRMALVAIELGDFLSEVDAQNADFYKANAKDVAAQMEDLAGQIQSELTTCEHDTFIVSHEAFGYLAQLTGLKQVGVSGIDPEVTPSPERLKQISDLVKETGSKVIYTEVNISPKVIEVLADDLGVETMTLDPAATQNDPHSDYVDIMKQNLENLQKGLGCK